MRAGITRDKTKIRGRQPRCGQGLEALGGARAAAGLGVGAPATVSSRMMVSMIASRQERVLDVVLVARTAPTSSCACRECVVE
jgi:hypothetical protein